MADNMRFDGLLGYDRCHIRFKLVRKRRWLVFSATLPFATARG